MKRAVWLVVLAAFISFVAGDCTLYVSNEGGKDNASCGKAFEPCATIYQAVNLAQPGDTVCVQATTTSYGCPLDGEGIVVNKSLTIESTNGSAVVDCHDKGRAFKFLNPATEVALVGVTIIGGYAVQGGALWSQSNMTRVKHCNFIGNAATVDNSTTSVAVDNGCGGAVYLWGGSSSFLGNTLSGNTARGAAGGAVAIFSAYGTVHHFYGNNFSSNSLSCVAARRHGLVPGRCTGGGLAIRIISGTALDGTFVTLENNTFTDNAVQYDTSVGVASIRGGGAAIFYGSASTGNFHRVSNNTFRRNSARIGGGLSVEYALPATRERHNFTSNFFEENSAEVAGGGMELAYHDSSSSGVHIFDRNRFLHNTASWGSAMRMLPWLPNRNHSFTFTENEFIANRPTIGPAQGGGGALYLQTHTLALASFNLSRNTIANNTGDRGAGMLMQCFDNCVNNSFRFVDNDISHNNATTAGGGIDLQYYSGAADNHHEFVANTFRHNVAPSGGAFWMLNEPEAMSVNECLQDGPPDWIYSNFISFRGDSFSSNSATFSGGALYLMYGALSLTDCVLANNSADQFGGAIYLVGESTAMTATESSFFANAAGTQGSHLWSLSSGPLAFFRSNFSASPEGSLMAVPHGGNVTFVATELACLAGAKMSVSSSSFMDNVFACSYEQFKQMQAVSFECHRCLAFSYNLLVGRANATDAAPFACHRCPSGAICASGGPDVLAQPDHWCHVIGSDPSAIECARCPMGYCCQEPACPWNQACAEGRTGLLCGDCLAGNSESFGTTGCVPDDECDAAPWLIPAALGVGLVYVLILLFLPVRRHPLWKSITYFMQVVPLVAGPKNPALTATLAVFSLDLTILGIHVNACPFPGITAVLKLASGYLVPVVLIAELALLFAAHTLYRWCCLRWWPERRSMKLLSVNREVVVEKPDTRGTRSSLIALYVGAVMALILLLFQDVTATTLALLHCVSIGGSLHLFRAGQVECFASWQYPLFVLLALLLPLPFLLPLAAHLLRKGPQWVRTPAQAVLGVLEAPYKPERRWWESAVLFRRAVLLSVATFVIDPVWRAVGLLVGCFAVVVSHFLLDPFADRYYGGVETAFLCDLVVIAALQAPQAAYMRLGLVLDTESMTVLQPMQEVLAVLPLLYCAVIVVWKNASYLFTRARGRWSTKRGGRHASYYARGDSYCKDSPTRESSVAPLMEEEREESQYIGEPANRKEAED